MNLFNRITVIVIDLMLLTIAVWLLLITAQVIIPEQLLLPVWLMDWTNRIVAASVRLKVLLALIAAATVLVGLILLYFELRPARKTEHQLTIRQDMLGAVTVSAHCIRQIVSREAGTIPGVLEVKARVKDQAEGLKILSRISVDPSANIAELGRSLQERVKAAVERLLSLPVAEVSVQAQIDPLQGKRRARRQLV